MGWQCELNVNETDTKADEGFLKYKRWSRQIQTKQVFHEKKMNNFRLNGDRSISRRLHNKRQNLIATASTCCTLLTWSSLSNCSSIDWMSVSSVIANWHHHQHHHHHHHHYRHHHKHDAEQTCINFCAAASLFVKIVYIIVSLISKHVSAHTVVF